MRKNLPMQELLAIPIMHTNLQHLDYGVLITRISIKLQSGVAQSGTALQFWEEKMKKGLHIAIAIFLGLSCTACAHNDIDQIVPQGIIKEESEETDKQGINRDVQEKGESAWKDSYTKKTNLLSKKDVVSMNGIAYQIIECTITKEFGDRNKETLVGYLGNITDIDADANLTGGKSYVFIKLYIKNETSNAETICRVPGNVMGIDANMQVLQLGDVIYIDKYWTEGDPSSVYYYMLNSGESIICESGYLINDDDMEVEGRILTYEIPHSSDMADLENKFISLEE